MPRQTRAGVGCFYRRVGGREETFEVTHLPIEWRGVVAPDFVDHNGHMNIERYFELHCRAVARVFDRFGIDDSYRARHRQGIFTIEQHLRYLNEAVVGEQISIRLRVLDRSDKIVHIISYLTNDDRHLLANTAELTAAHVNLDTRRAVPFTSSAAAAIDRELTRASHLPWPPMTCGSMGAGRRRPTSSANHRSTAYRSPAPGDEEVT